MPQPRPNIVFHLAAEVHRLLQRELKGADGRRGGVAERVALGLLHTLSRSRRLRDLLLFRDFDQDWADLWLLPVGSDEAAEPCADPPGEEAPERLFKPALIYVTLVLSRRLTLANNLKEHPTNMHVLLGLLAAHGPADQGWPAVRVARATQAPAPADPPAGIARTLAAQVRRLGTGYGPISADRRAAYGPLWLTIPGCAAELAEELTLWDCLAGLPVPVERDLDEASLYRLNRVLESLNERYALLRSCGLDPDQWHEDPELSIAGLRALHGLRKRAEDLLAREPVQGAIAPETAYAEAFAALQTGGWPLAGFADFSAFARSRVGEQMIHRGPRSLDEPLRIAEDDSLPLGAAIPAPDPGSDATGPEHEADRLAALAYVIAQCPGIRNDPVLDWFARATLIAGRLIQGPDGVLADPAFRSLVAASARDAAADDETLLTDLELDLTAAVRDCQGRLGQR